MACPLRGRCRYSRGRRTPALVNFALHAYLAVATSMLLPPPMGMPSLNVTGSQQGGVSQQELLELQPAQQAAVAQLQLLQHVKPPAVAAAAVAAAVAFLEQAGASNSSAGEREVEAEAALA